MLFNFCFRNVCIGALGCRHLRFSIGGEPQSHVERHAVLGRSHIARRAAREGERLDRERRAEERYARFLYTANFLLSCLVSLFPLHILAVAQQLALCGQLCCA